MTKLVVLVAAFVVGWCLTGAFGAEPHKFYMPEARLAEDRDQPVWRPVKFEVGTRYRVCGEMKKGQHRWVIRKCPAMYRLVTR